MACAGCEKCGDGMFQLHVTFETNPGDIGVKVYEILNLMPNGQWKREWITGENMEGIERDAKLRLRHTALCAKEPNRAIRQKIEVPVKKLLGSHNVMYIEAHVKMLLTAPNLEIAIQEQRHISINVLKPGTMMMTFRQKRYRDVVNEIKAAKLERFYGWEPEAPTIYEAAIFDTNPELDDDWIPPTWRTS